MKEVRLERQSNGGFILKGLSSNGSCLTTEAYGSLAPTLNRVSDLFNAVTKSEQDEQRKTERLLKAQLALEKANKDYQEASRKV